jgi:tetratricopeptide (TPR) repeat protein
MKFAVKQPVEQSTKQSISQAQRFWFRRPWLVVGLAFIVLLLAGGGAYWLFLPRMQPLSLPKLPAHLSMADLGLAEWESYQQPLPADALNNPQLPATPQVKPNLAALQHAAGLALLKQQQVDRGLAYLRVATEAAPGDLRYGNGYRLALRGQKHYDQEVQFFAAQLKQYNTTAARINLALSYVDQMRSCPPPPDGLVCQAQFSSRSTSQLDTILTAQPYNVIARYSRGLNHLYWPSLMGHLSRAQQDLSYAVALARPLSAISNSFTGDAYTALGDVFAKDNQVDAARNVWLNGLQVVPDSSLLKGRLAIAKEKLAEEESGSLRGLGVYVETDMSLFWTKGR